MTYDARIFDYAPWDMGLFWHLISCSIPHVGCNYFVVLFLRDCWWAAGGPHADSGSPELRQIGKPHQVPPMTHALRPNLEIYVPAYFFFPHLVSMKFLRMLHSSAL
jgi:hypothetical protein